MPDIYDPDPEIDFGPGIVDHVFRADIHKVQAIADRGDARAKLTVDAIDYALKAIRAHEPQATCTHCFRGYQTTQELACCSIFYAPDKPNDPVVMTFCTRCATSLRSVAVMAARCIKDNTNKETKA